MDGALAPARWLRLAHGEIAYRQAGAGPALLLLHGWAASSRYWFATQAALADIRTSYALDLPGFGESPPLDTPGTIGRLAELAIEFADTLGLAQFDINGHSFGAAVAAELARRWPERVRTLTISSLGVRRSPAERALIGLAQLPAGLALPLWQPWVNFGRPWLRAWRPVAAHLLGTPPIPRLLASWYLDQLPDDSWMLREGIADLLSMDFGAHLACVASIGDPGFTAALRVIRAPVLVVGGDRDRVASPDDLRAAAELVAGGRAAVLERCGHVPMIEQPAAYHAALRSFLLGT
jgi:pimeloyl-ACP methyl ester carboxylesterase